jgi:broad specificity phosphatase PhoE
MAAAAAAAASPVEATSLDGSLELRRRAFPPERRAKLEADLAAAEARHAASPADVDAIVWHARRLGYLDRYQEAIAVLTAGLALHPDEPQLYRHRGHRFITVRRFQAAVADFEAAARLCGPGLVADSVEPDGAPNAAGIPTSTLHTNIFYHLGLARFLLGQYGPAAAAYRNGLACPLCTLDMRVAFSDWLYMSLRRLGLAAEAAAVLEVAGAESEALLEDFAYQARLKLYKGEVGPEAVLQPEGGRGDGDGGGAPDPLNVATQGFGVADWYAGQGRNPEAVSLLRQVAGSSYWPSFAAVAAEADLLRLSLAAATAVQTKIVYWIRHAEGTHNVAQEEAMRAYRKANPRAKRAAMGEAAYAAGMGVAINTALRHGHTDADLTTNGVAQLQALRPKAAAMVAASGPGSAALQLVVSSSLRRTLRTAVEPFAGLGVPFVALDQLREVAGAFDCERRRPLAEIAAQFPGVDTAALAAEDTYWVADRAQASAEALERAVEALDIVMTARPEQVVALVSHGATMAAVFGRGSSAAPARGARHPRIVCAMDPPKRNCEVVATVLSRDPVTKTLTLEPWVDCPAGITGATADGEAGGGSKL